MRALLPVFLVLLAACGGQNAAFRKEADAPEAFSRDDAACATAARLRLPSRSVSYDRNRVFNRLYGDCMTAQGHSAGPYARTLPDNPG